MTATGAEQPALGREDDLGHRVLAPDLARPVIHPRRWCAEPCRGVRLRQDVDVASRPAPPPGERWHALLNRLCRRCVDELGCDHASIGIATGPTQLAPGAATTPEIVELEEYAFLVGEGPCLDALREHVPVVVADLNTREAQARWPAWSGAAASRHICAATAFPIEAGAIVAGVLTVYSRTAWQPAPRQMQAARRLVDVALLVLLDMAVSIPDGNGTDPSLDGRADDLAVLLRADVHRAAGMVMAQANIPIDQALSRLRAHAFAAGRTLPEVAAEVL